VLRALRGTGSTQSQSVMGSGRRHSGGDDQSQRPSSAAQRGGHLMLRDRRANVSRETEAASRLSLSAGLLPFVLVPVAERAVGRPHLNQEREHGATRRRHGRPFWPPSWALTFGTRVSRETDGHAIALSRRAVRGARPVSECGLPHDGSSVTTFAPGPGAPPRWRRSARGGSAGRAPRAASRR